MSDRTTEHDGREMWKYGDAGDEIPVSEGDVWSVGNNHILCGDLYDDSFQYMTQNYGPPDMIYMDPPHGPAHEKSYRTKAGLDSDAADFAKLMNKVAAYVDTDVTEHIFCEAGNEDAFLMANILEEAWDITMQEVWDITYYEDKPCKLLYFGDRNFGGRFVGMDDTDTPFATMEAVMEETEIETVADPFTGKTGFTFRDAHKHGCTYFGTELHPRRMARMLQKRSEQVGVEPELVAEDVL